MFRVLQQTPSSRRPDRGCSDPGLCPSGILLPPNALPSSTRASWRLFPLPPHCFLWLFFGLHLLFPVCRRLCSGSDWRTPDCPPPLAYTWSSTRSSDNPRPAPVTFPSFFLEPAPSSPPMELSAPARLVVLSPLRPR